MIVKNEIKVIRRCLESIRDYIDTWVIVDTGSSDGTQEAVKKTLQSVPGELHEHPWVDFATCRNVALSLVRGKADFALFIDADEVFSPEKNFSWPPLEKDCYFASFLLENGSLIQRLFLADVRLPWTWKGALHEELTSEETRSGGILERVKIVVIQDGSRSLDPQKYLKDAAMLERELKKNPYCCRSAFYLGISYDMARAETRALDAYQRRSRMGGWDEEIYYALYRSGCLQEKLGHPQKTVIHTFCQAFAARPQRAEPLNMLAKIFNEKNTPFLAYLLAQFAITLPLPTDRAFVEEEVYDYKLLIQKADAATLLGLSAEAIAILKRVLTKKSLPQEKRRQIERALSL